LAVVWINHQSIDPIKELSWVRLCSLFRFQINSEEVHPLEISKGTLNKTQAYPKAGEHNAEQIRECKHTTAIMVHLLPFFKFASHENRKA
jgi:hypothetical protein